MNVAVTGTSGLIGSALVNFLTSKGHTVHKIVRSKSQEDGAEIDWLPENGDWDTAFSNGLDAIVHLAGENIASDRWSEKKKEKIRTSRIMGTRRLCEKILKLDKPPSVFVCASAIGFYGDRGDEILTEESAIGDRFLSEVCEKWEGEAAVAASENIRVVSLRFAMVISSEGGAVQAMLSAFKKGIGGRLGSGKQYVSWVVIDDAINAIHHVLTDDSLSGPVNVSSPNPVTNKVFTKTFGKIIRRPTFIPMPAFAVRLVFGEMADELLLASTRVEPAKLINSGFKFEYPDIADALRNVLVK
ncbi:MAG: TIGR01777 family oxidoreductase [Candidatus Anammoxibacter sp.]